MTQQQLVKKISPRTVFGTKADIQKLVLSDQDAEHPLFMVAGKCNGRKDGEGDNGPWTALLGRFMAQKLSAAGVPEGVIYVSGRCHLPNYVIESVLGQMDEPGDIVQFKFIIGATYDETSATSYVYTAKPLLEAKPEDDDVLQLFTTPQAALPPPNKKRGRPATARAQQEE